MADNDDNVFESYSPEMGVDELRSGLAEEEYYVDDLENHLEQYSGDYSAEQLQAFREVENARDDPRTTALDAIDEEFDAVTAGPDSVSASEASFDRQEVAERDAADDEYVRMFDIGNDTELPMPGTNEAPAMVDVFLPSDMLFAGERRSEGVHSVPFTMRVVRDLEPPRVVHDAWLAESDPYHPKYEGDDELTAETQA